MSYPYRHPSPRRPTNNLETLNFLDFLSKLFEKLWFKLVVEILLLVILFGAYFILRFLLPKKYKVKDKTFKTFYKKLSNILLNFPKGDDNIFTIINKARGIFADFHDWKMDESTDGFIKGFAKQNDLEIEYDYVFVHTIFPNIRHLAQSSATIEEYSSEKVITEYDFGEGRKVYLFVNKNSSKGETLSYNVAYPKNFNYNTLLGEVLKAYDNRLYVEMDEEQRIQFKKLDYSHNETNYFPNKILLEKMKNEIGYFRSLNVQRTYLLYGESGTGKTTFALKLSQELFNSVVKIDAKVLNYLDLESMEKLIENLNCNMIILDDVDRMWSNNITYLLFILETLKNFTNKPIVILTVNSLEALDAAILRPGRADEIIEFELPNEIERKEFISILLEKYKVEISPSDLNKFVIATENFSQAYIKEYCTQLQYANNVELIINKIEQRKRLMEKK